MFKLPKNPIRVDPQIIFRYAESFAVAVELLIPQYQTAAYPLEAGVIAPKIKLHVSIGANTAPCMMVDTFSLELYLKCLHAMDHGGLVRTGHDTKQLYGRLKRSTKQRLRKNYLDAVSKSKAPSTMKKRERASWVGFNAYIQHSRYAFDEVRYLFERASTKKRRIRFWPLLRIAARQTILEIMPEWACRNVPTSPLR